MSDSFLSRSAVVRVNVRNNGAFGVYHWELFPILMRTPSDSPETFYERWVEQHNTPFKFEANGITFINADGDDCRLDGTLYRKGNKP